MHCQAKPINLFGGLQAVDDSDANGVDPSVRTSASRISPGEAEFRRRYRQDIDDRLASYRNAEEAANRQAHPAAPIAAARPVRQRGPGEYIQSGEAMSLRSWDHQSRVTGLPRGLAYRVGRVKFDGYHEARGVLVEAKGPRYAAFIKNGRFRKDFKALKSLLNQAKRQSEATPEIPIEWLFAEKVAADAIRQRISELGFDNIKVMSTQ